MEEGAWYGFGDLGIREDLGLEIPSGPWATDAIIEHCLKLGSVTDHITVGFSRGAAASFCFERWFKVYNNNWLSQNVVPIGTV